MPDDDPLAALSAAAKNRAAPSPLPNTRFAPRSPAYGGGGYRRKPRRPKKSPLLPILGAVAFVIILVVVAVVITIKLTRQPPAPAPAPAPVPPVVEAVEKPAPVVAHPQGELFKNVPTPAPAPTRVPPVKPKPGARPWGALFQSVPAQNPAAE